MGAYYAAFEAMRRRAVALRGSPKLELSELAVAGAGGGVAFWTVALPLDFAKTRLQVGAEAGSASVAGVLLDAVRAGGLRRIYVGYASALARGVRVQMGQHTVPFHRALRRCGRRCDVAPFDLAGAARRSFSFVYRSPAARGGGGRESSLDLVAETDADARALAAELVASLRLVGGLHEEDHRRRRALLDRLAEDKMRDLQAQLTRRCTAERALTSRLALVSFPWVLFLFL